MHTRMHTPCLKFLFIFPQFWGKTHGKLFPPCNYDQFQLRLPFFTPSNIFLLIGVVTQEEWHQRLVWIIPGQLTDVQATCVYAVEVFMPGVIAHFYPRECKLQMSSKKCNKSSAFQFFCSPHKCRNLMLCLCIYDPDNGARFQS